MPRKVYQTRFLGYAPDPERLHDARPQLVYEVIEPREPDPLTNKSAPDNSFPWPLAFRLAIAALIYFAIRAA